MKNKELTYLQKVTLKGDIAHALISCSHDADVRLRLYIILKTISKETRPYVLDIFKEAITLSEDDFNRVYFETFTEKVPLWLWTDKVLEDIKKNLRSDPLEYVVTKISVDKIKEKKHLIENAFIAFVRRVTLVSPKAASELLNRITEDDELSFLSTSCFYLRQFIQEFISKNKKYVKMDEVSSDVLNLEFNINLSLSSPIDEGISQVTEEDFRSSSEDTEDTEEEQDNFENSNKQVISEKIIIAGSITPEELSSYLSQKIIEKLNATQSNQTTNHEMYNRKEQKIKYQIQKIWLDSKVETAITSFSSKEEAEKFIQNIKNEFPEQEGICDYFVKKIVER